MIKTLEELYEATDSVLVGVSQCCCDCDYDDCKGYIWLLSGEAAKLYEEGLPILEVNDRLAFLHPYAEDEGVNVEKLKPSCPYCKERRCQIREIRPLNCRLYPLNFACENGRLYLVLHLDCRYADTVGNDPEFLNRAISLFEQVDEALLSEILETYLSYDSLSAFPCGRNRYMILTELQKIEKGGD